MPLLTETYTRSLSKDFAHDFAHDFDLPSPHTSTCKNFCALELTLKQKNSAKRAAEISRLSIKQIYWIALTSTGSQTSQLCATATDAYMRGTLTRAQFLLIILPTLLTCGLATTGAATLIQTKDGLIATNSLLLLVACKVESIFHMVHYHNTSSLAFEGLKQAFAPLPHPTTVQQWINRCRHFSNAISLTNTNLCPTSSSESLSPLVMEFCASYVTTVTKETTFYGSLFIQNILIDLQPDHESQWAPGLHASPINSLRLNYALQHQLRPVFIQHNRALVLNAPGFIRYIAQPNELQPHDLQPNNFWDSLSFFHPALSSIQLPGENFEELLYKIVPPLKGAPFVTTIQYIVPQPTSKNPSISLEMTTHCLEHCQRLLPNLEEFHILLPPLKMLNTYCTQESLNESLTSIFATCERARDHNKSTQRSTKAISIACTLDSTKFSNANKFGQYLKSASKNSSNIYTPSQI